MPLEKASSYKPSFEERRTGVTLALEDPLGGIPYYVISFVPGGNWERGTNMKVSSEFNPDNSV
jgi:hypothetical protein